MRASALARDQGFGDGFPGQQQAFTYQGRLNAQRESAEGPLRSDVCTL